jgi:hypothetical protein
VRKRADQVRVADHRPRPRARRELVLARAPTAPKESGRYEEEHDGEERTPLE